MTRLLGTVSPQMLAAALDRAKPHARAIMPSLAKNRDGCIQAPMLGLVDFLTGERRSVAEIVHSCAADPSNTACRHSTATAHVAPWRSIARQRIARLGLA